MRAHSLVIAVGLLLSWGKGARAAEALLLPSHPLVADGARVHTLRLYVIERGALEPGPQAVHALRGAIVGTPAPAVGGGLDLRYRPPRVRGPERDTIRVVAGGRTLEAQVALEPPGRTQLELRVTPDPLLLAKGAEAEVRLSVRDAAGRPTRAPLRLGASVGRISPLVETSIGELSARYTPPEERFPQVAILAALSLADGAFSARPLKLSARVPVSGEGEPGATMQLLVEGRTFGPETIDASGRFTLPIVVPPGGRAVGISTDRLGNQKRREIDLQLPSFPRLVLAAVPNELIADGQSRAEVVAFAVDARGNPERGRAPRLSAERGTLSPPQPRADGVWSWTFTAPEGTGSGAVRLRGGTEASSAKRSEAWVGTAEARVTLRPAPPFRIELEPGEPLGAGVQEPAEVTVRVVDAFGSPVTGAELQAALAGGRVIGTRELGGGSYAISVVPPRDPGRGAARLHVELRALRAGSPRRVTLHATRAPEGKLAAEAWVDDDLGLPVPGAKVVFSSPDGRVERITDGYGTARVELQRPAGPTFGVTAEPDALPGLAAHLDWVQAGGALLPVASLAGQGVLVGAQSPPGASLDAEVPLRPAAPVDVRLTVEPRHPRPGQAARIGVSLSGAGAIAWQASGGTVEVVAPLHPAARGQAAELRFVPPPGAPPGARYLVSVTETRTRVTAFVEVVVK
jgi:hypothetical protein